MISPKSNWKSLEKGSEREEREPKRTELLPLLILILPRLELPSLDLIDHVGIRQILVHLQHSFQLSLTDQEVKKLVHSIIENNKTKNSLYRFLSRKFVY